MSVKRKANPKKRDVPKPVKKEKLFCLECNYEITKIQSVENGGLCNECKRLAFDADHEFEKGDDFDDTLFSTPDSIDNF